MSREEQGALPSATRLTARDMFPQARLDRFNPLDLANVAVEPGPRGYMVHWKGQVEGPYPDRDEAIRRAQGHVWASDGTRRDFLARFDREYTVPPVPVDMAVFARAEWRQLEIAAMRAERVLSALVARQGEATSPQRQLVQ